MKKRDLFKWSIPVVGIVWTGVQATKKFIQKQGNENSRKAEEAFNKEVENERTRTSSYYKSEKPHHEKDFLELFIEVYTNSCWQRRQSIGIQWVLRPSTQLAKQIAVEEIKPVRIVDIFGNLYLRYKAGGELWQLNESYDLVKAEEEKDIKYQEFTKVLRENYQDFLNKEERERVLIIKEKSKQLMKEEELRKEKIKYIFIKNQAKTPAKEDDIKINNYAYEDELETDDASIEYWQGRSENNEIDLADSGGDFDNYWNTECVFETQTDKNED